MEDLNNFATKNNVYLSSEELIFTYGFVKKNWADIIRNPGSLNIEQYKDKYSPENFIKIQALLQEYFNKFQGFM